ncbi:hypothetical protein PR048_012682 [Dryococelus australis]|uniref:Uncharacterized protein n=1 Tax=Dryococelus australis TaxID=614101 RepID=A0ABQ9HQ30_9NEOP|nr:hypothetical protein PR048_012682 [Dryococelus australis]
MGLHKQYLKVGQSAKNRLFGVPPPFKKTPAGSQDSTSPIQMLISEQGRVNHERVHRISGAAVAQWLAHSPPTTAIRVRSPAGTLPGPRMWESYWTMPLPGGLSRGTPVSHALAFQRRSILGSHFMSCSGTTGTYGSRLESPGHCGKRQGHGSKIMISVNDIQDSRQLRNNMVVAEFCLPVPHALYHICLVHAPLIRNVLEFSEYPRAK